MRSVLMSAVLLTAAIFLDVGIGSGHAQQPSADRTGAFTMGEIGRRVAYGSDGKWETTATDDGSLVIKSLNRDGSWTASIVPAPDRPYTMQIKLHSEIAPEPGHAVGGGIAFGFQRAKESQDPKFYVAVVAGKTLFVYAFENGSIRQLARSEGTGADKEFDTLKVSVSGNTFSVSRNDNGSISQSVGDALTGEIGVFASGSGRVLFRDLDIQ